MANTSDPKRTKCSGLKNGSRYEFWIWCTLLKCFISLPCIFSTCLGVDLSVRLNPSGDIYVEHGNFAEIFCIVENNNHTNYTSNDLKFTIGSNNLRSTIVNDTTVKLFMKKPEKQVSTYSCINKKTNKKCSVRMIVDSIPMNVTDFRCVSKNLEVLNCSWTFPPYNTIIDYSLTFLVNGNTVKPCKPEKINNRLLYCTWNTSSEPRYRQQEEKYFFILKATNKIGVNIQNFTIDHFSIVKPDPPSNLKKVRESPHGVILQWNIPNTMVDLLPCGVDHRIEYQIAKIDNRTYFHNVNAKKLPPHNKTYKFPLQNLPYAFMQYEVRVYIKSKKASDEYWSDYTYKVFNTASERPKRSPELITGAFIEADYEKDKMIWIYWKQLEEYEEAGANFTYRVEVSQGSLKPRVLYPDKNKSLSYVNLTVAREPMEVKVWSQNEMGLSENSSILYIPAKTESKLKVTTFTQLTDESSTYKLSWVGKENISNYTLFWCQYNVSYICPGRMNFTVLDGTKNSYEINLPKEHRYQFAISANNGTKTSGITWATCAISKDVIPMYRFPIEMTNDAPGKSYVRLAWTMTCTLQEGIITGYILTYCVVVNTSNECDPMYEEKKINITNPAETYANITDLLPHKTYIIKLNLNTTYGVKTLNATRSITTTEDAPTKPRNVAVTNVQNTTVVISWDPPNPRNGILGKYVIYDSDKVFYVVIIEHDSNDIKRRNVTLTNLDSFRKYNLSVQACNIGINSCSERTSSESIIIETKMGAPSKLSMPKLDKHGNDDYLKWDPPKKAGGYLGLYQIRKAVNDNEVTIYNASDNLYFQLILCKEDKERETYKVRVWNYDLNNTVNRSPLYHSEWSDELPVTCKNKKNDMIFLTCFTLLALVALTFMLFKLYKKYRKMGDIKPVLPEGLNIPEKDTKYAYGGWNPVSKDEKSSGDEVLLLPNSKSIVPSPEVKQKESSNCGSSDHTDSTVLSDISRGAVDRHASTSDNSSNSSLNSEVETVKVYDNNPYQDGYSLDNSDLESLRENSPYFSGSVKKDSGLVVNPASGYVQSIPTPNKNQLTKQPAQPASSSYVMASLSPSIFTTGIMLPNVSSDPPTSSGYVRHDDAQINSLMNLPNLGLSPIKAFGPDSLPSMPTLPQPANHSTDCSYIQLQSLNAMPSFKTSVNNIVPSKPQASNGYVSSNDPILNKHLNSLSSGQPVEESAILDPTMSPDAYCRFSWSTDPANDNLNSFYPSKN